jgi:hypothetical protein
MKHQTLDHLQSRNLLVSHSLFPPTNLKRAVEQLGFVQADPIRSPARSQELDPAERFEKLLLLTTCLFGPTTQNFLLSELRHNNPVRDTKDRKRILHSLIERGKLDVIQFDGVEYLYTKPAKP